MLTGDPIAVHWTPADGLGPKVTRGLLVSISTFAVAVTVDNSTRRIPWLLKVRKIT